MHTLAIAKPTKEEREEDVRNADAVAVTPGQEPKLTLAFVVKACFAVTKV